MDFHFRLSASPPHEWENILNEKLIRNRTTRNALMEASIHDREFFKAANDYVLKLYLRVVVLGDEMKWTAKERNVEKHFKELEKCIKETNRQYTRFVAQKLKQEERDKRSASGLRNKLFGKKKR